jgi:hypothetical protein
VSNSDGAPPIVRTFSVSSSERPLPISVRGTLSRSGTSHAAVKTWTFGN